MPTSAPSKKKELHPIIGVEKEAAAVKSKRRVEGGGDGGGRREKKSALRRKTNYPLGRVVTRPSG